MATFTVQMGRRYRATISLGWLERWASNDTIAEQLRAAGFSDVSVTGSGGTRTAEALWPGPDTTGEMPPADCCSGRSDGLRSNRQRHDRFELERYHSCGGHCLAESSLVHEAGLASTTFGSLKLNHTSIASAR